MMKHIFWGMAFLLLSAIPTISHAKGAPLFFQTGDELFEVAGAPKFDEGYSVGYACQRFGLFGADIWTWDCKLMAVNLEEFSVGELPEEMVAEYSQQFTLSDRIRNPWNHYGALLMALLLAGITFAKLRRQAAA